jgi:hypothetical protein
MQLVDYRWVPLSELYNVKNIGVFDARDFGFFRKISWKVLKDSISKNIVNADFPSINVGMKR